MLTKQSKGQLQSEHEWDKHIDEAQNKAIYILWIMMTIK
jgi:hypothetical protein